eukprot:tig00021623_g23014.t1
MEVNYSLSRLLPENFCVIQSKDLERLTGPVLDNARDLIDRMGGLSAKAQGLKQVITTVARLRYSDQRLYVASENQQRKVIGILKVGKKKLFVRNESLILKEIEPLCVLDFYVHESCQRTGHGRALFDYMLVKENVHPARLGYDRPSPKLLGFLAKHFGLRAFHPQENNFVVFHKFWRGPKPRRPAAASRSPRAPPTPRPGPAPPRAAAPSRPGRPRRRAALACQTGGGSELEPAAPALRQRLPRRAGPQASPAQEPYGYPPAQAQGADYGRRAVRRADGYGEAQAPETTAGAGLYAPWRAAASLPPQPSRAAELAARAGAALAQLNEAIASAASASASAASPRGSTARQPPRSASVGAARGRWGGDQPGGVQPGAVGTVAVMTRAARLHAGAAGGGAPGGGGAFVGDVVRPVAPARPAPRPAYCFLTALQAAARLAAAAAAAGVNAGGGRATSPAGQGPAYFQFNKADVLRQFAAQHPAYAAPPMPAGAPGPRGISVGRLRPRPVGF